jgi:hypothetical protein
MPSHVQSLITPPQPPFLPPGSVKSPQAIMGTLVKRRLAAARGWDPARVYHATVMPCYDKKLEASRDDFNLPGEGFTGFVALCVGGLACSWGLGRGVDGVDLRGHEALGPLTHAALPSAPPRPRRPGTSTPEVDCALTTGELQQLLDGWDAGRLAEVEPSPLDALLEPGEPAAGAAAAAGQQQAAAAGGWGAAYPAGPGREPPLHGARGGSGGYLEAVARAAAGALLGAAAAPPPGAPLPLRPGRNPDLREVTIDAPAPGAAAAAGAHAAAAAPPRPLRFAAAYGFRNIQSLVRKIKLGRCEFDYVEVMACPGGCLNGGGQAKPPPGRSAAALLEAAEVAYFRQAEWDAWAGAALAGCCSGGGACGSGSGCGGGGGGGGGGGPCDMEVDGASSTAAPVGPAEQQEQAQQQPHRQQRPACEPWRPVLGGAARALYAGWVGGGPGSAGARALLHTAYHHREKTALGTVGDW